MGTITVEVDGPVTVVTIDRSEVRNAVDPPTATALIQAFAGFDADLDRSVAVLTGAGGTFCAGFDLKALARGEFPVLDPEGDASPMGPVRMLLSKPVLAAVEGYAVGGGLELALWCDLRVAATDAVFGVFNRRFGVPLIDGGSVRLPRIVGHGRAMDMILTGRAVAGAEALRFGLANRLVEPGRALVETIALARELAALPQASLRSDRRSALEGWALPFDEAVRNEAERGAEAIASGESAQGAGRFAGGAGRHGDPTEA